MTASDRALLLAEVADRADLEKAFFYVAKFYLENSEDLNKEVSLPSGELIAKIISTLKT